MSGTDGRRDTGGRERRVAAAGRVARLRAAAPDALASLCAGAAGVAGSYAVAGPTPGFAAAPVAGFLSRTMPGAVVTVAITVLGSLGQVLNLATAVALTAVGFGAVVHGAGAVADRTGWPALAAPVLGGVGVGVVTVVLTGAVPPATGAGVAAGAVASLPRVASAVDVGDGSADPSGRRRALAALVGLVGAGSAGAILGGDRGGTAEADQRRVTGEAAEMLAEAREKSLGVEGMDPLVSEGFYEVDISAVNPKVAADGWSLSMTGAVGTELELGYEELTGRESREAFNTLRCVGEPLNGHKMDNALWTVVDVAPLLEEAGAPDECCVMARAKDGYFEEFPRAALESASLAYRMNGRPLPRKHGAPVRLLVPGHWGEINVKWVDEIEVLEEPATGYWERRGWHGTGPVNTVAKLHAENRLDDGRMEVGGHAYAGTRGVERVEVSTDGGETWTDAELSERLPGDDVWRQWRHVYDPPDGGHEVVVRAVDGTGTLQPRERNQAYPSGATGWVSRDVES